MSTFWNVNLVKKKKKCVLVCLNSLVKLLCNELFPDMNFQR